MHFRWMLPLLHCVLWIPLLTNTPLHPCLSLRSAVNRHLIPSQHWRQLRVCIASSYETQVEWLDVGDIHTCTFGGCFLFSIVYSGFHSSPIHLCTHVCPCGPQ